MRVSCPMVRIPLFLAAVSLAFVRPASAGLVQLGSLGGGSTIARAINNPGQIVGTSKTAAGKMHAFVYSAGTMTDLGTLGGDNSDAADINDSGQIVGVSDTGSDPHVFLYSGGMMTDLGSPVASPLGLSVVAMNDSGAFIGIANGFAAYLYSGGVFTDLSSVGFPSVTPNAINNAGQVVGWAYTAAFDHHAFLYDGGVRTDLDPVDPYSEAVAINDAGQIVVNAFTASDQGRTFLYDHGVTTELQPLGAGKDPGNPPYVQATKVNASGMVTGASTTKLGDGGFATLHAFRYAAGKMLDLGTLPTFYPEATDSNGVVINASGQIAGTGMRWLSATTWTRDVFLFDGSMHDLGNLGSSGIDVTDMNDTGQIIGTSTADGGMTYTSFVRGPACGDGLTDPGEECDDGNLSDGDCCASDCTYPGPATTCLTAAASSVKLKNATPDGKDQLKWKWAGGQAFAGSAIGDPSTTTAYMLCISDSTGGVDRLVAQLPISPGSQWKSKSAINWGLSDKTGGNAGIVKVKILAGDAGATSIQLGAKGLSIPMPEPVSATKFFDQDTRVTVQLFNSVNSACWSSTFTAAQSNTPAGFSASAP